MNLSLIAFMYIYTKPIDEKTEPCLLCNDLIKHEDDSQRNYIREIFFSLKNYQRSLIFLELLQYYALFHFILKQTYIKKRINNLNKLFFVILLCESQLRTSAKTFTTRSRCYRYYDKDNNLLYVGQKSKKRVLSYFNKTESILQCQAKG